MVLQKETKDTLQGGEFLIKDIDANAIFIPEEYSEDQLMMADMFRDFIKTKINPVIDQLENLDIELTKKLLEEAGELGILGTSFPEEYGGSMQDFVTNMYLSEVFAEARSFALSAGAHTGIGMLPILYFGNEEQKKRYLPDMVLGIKKAAYCLTEPGSGSDALAAKSKAVLSEDGKHYILNGQKMWITNAGFADVFTVFAKIDGEHFTGFIVENEWEGVSTAAEEKKMGIKGSSTRQVFFENVKVPVENVLGEIGKGHKIAFNILNIGRIKLGASTVGAAKVVADQSIKYANERHQFKVPISSFGAIKQKLAEQAIRIFVNESAVYRASQDIHHKESSLLADGKDLSAALLGGAEEYSIECALMKVHGSECLDYVVDEGVQIYGGMGFSEEAPMASAYRDSRINRIFEGTNEINRMLAVDRLMRKALRGTLDFLTPGMAVQKEIMSMPSFDSGKSDDWLHREKNMIKNMKKAFLLIAGATAQKLMKKLVEEQEVLMYMSDIMADIYLCESSLLRTEKFANMKGKEAADMHFEMTRTFMDDAIERINVNGKRCIAAWAEGDMKRTLLMGLKRFTKYEPINAKAARRKIADKLIEKNSYCF